MNYAFRIRFALSQFARLSDATENELHIRTESGRDVKLRAHGRGQSLQDADQLVLLGRGFVSQKDAHSAGIRWRGFAERALARINVGADFGDRSPSMYMTPAYLGALAQQHGVERMLQDKPGLTVFSEEPWPVFALTTLTASVRRPAPQLAKAIETAHTLEVEISDRERTAFDLYSSSMFLAQGSADARFLMLMMALETLVDQQPRSMAAVALVEKWILDVKESELSGPEVASFRGSLEYLRVESISGAGRRLVQSLGDRLYGHPDREPPAKFFTQCYELRSRLVHGAHPRPTFEEVNQRTAGLEVMVSDLLSGELLEGFDCKPSASSE